MRTMFLFLCVIGLALSSSPPNAEVDVIIIGAGWSGMGAAYELASNKQSNFVVLEGTKRTGGRTQQMKFGDASSVGQFIIELGSNWIDGAPFHGGPSRKQQPIYAEALRQRKLGKFDITLIPGGTQNQSNYWAVYDSNGKRGDVDGKIRMAANHALDCINRTASKGRDMTVRAAMTQCGWNPKTEVELAVDWGAVVDDPGVSGDEQALLMTLPDETYMWWGPDDWMVVDQNPRGFAKLLDTMTQHLIPANDPRLVFDAVVTKIDWSSSPVVVTTKDGRTFSGKQVISTLPLGVLKHDHKSLFNPGLPSKQAAAIEKADMAALGKVFLQFKTVFWDNSVARWLTGDSEYGAFPEWHNLNHDLHIPGSQTLFCWIGEPQTTKWEAQTDAQVIAGVMTFLKKRYPGKTLEDPVAFHITRHSLDPMRYGAYSLLPNGFTEHEFNQMIKPLKSGGDARVYFGGEHSCDDLNGFTHGAWIRGREVVMDMSGDYSADRMCDY